MDLVSDDEDRSLRSLARAIHAADTRVARSAEDDAFCTTLADYTEPTVLSGDTVFIGS